MAANLEQASRLQTAFTLHRAALYAYARRRTSTVEDAEEAVSATYLTAWRRVDVMPTEPETRRWLYAVIRRSLANQRRANCRFHTLQSRLGRQRESATLDESDSPVNAALAQLRPGDREVLRLSSWERLSYVEASEILHCSPNAYAIRLHRARIALRVALTDPAANLTQ